MARATYQPTNTPSHPSSQLIPSHSTLRLTCGTSGPGDRRSHQHDDHGPEPPAPPAAPSPCRARTRAALQGMALGGSGVGRTRARAEQHRYSCVSAVSCVVPVEIAERGGLILSASQLTTCRHVAPAARASPCATTPRRSDRALLPVLCSQGGRSARGRRRDAVQERAEAASQAGGEGAAGGGEGSCQGRGSKERAREAQEG